MYINMYVYIYIYTFYLTSHVQKDTFHDRTTQHILRENSDHKKHVQIPCDNTSWGMCVYVYMYI